MSHWDKQRIAMVLQQHGLASPNTYHDTECLWNSLVSTGHPNVNANNITKRMVSVCLIVRIRMYHNNNMSLVLLQLASAVKYAKENPHLMNPSTDAHDGQAGNDNRQIFRTKKR